MTIYVVIILLMLLFKEQAKQLLSAVISLIQAVSTAIVSGMKQ